MESEIQIKVIPATEEEKKLLLNFITKKSNEGFDQEEEIDTYIFFKDSLVAINKIIITKKDYEKIYYNTLMLPKSDIYNLSLTDLALTSTKKEVPKTLSKSTITYDNEMYEFIDNNFQYVESNAILDY